jgi:alanyl-tRNA synthetase
VVAVVGAAGERPSVVVAVNETAREWGVKAGELVRVGAGALGGGGGGRDDVAQGGGTNAAPDARAAALAAMRDFVGRRVTGSA